MPQKVIFETSDQRRLKKYPKEMLLDTVIFFHKVHFTNRAILVNTNDKERSTADYPYYTLKEFVAKVISIKITKAPG